MSNYYFPKRTIKEELNDPGIVEGDNVCARCKLHKRHPNSFSSICDDCRNEIENRCRKCFSNPRYSRNSVLCQQCKEKAEKKKKLIQEAMKQVS